MLEYARWKYVLLAIVLVLATIYSLPNLFPQDPAVQISASRGNTVDEALKEKVQGTLERGKIAFKSVTIDGDRLLVRLNDPDAQTPASEALRTELGDTYSVALNLASTVPAWLEAIRARPMSLGLDLRGGMHYLMEVDMRAALEKQQERYLEDTRTVLRDNDLRRSAINRTPDGMQITFRTKEDRDQAYIVLARDLPQLSLADGETSDDTFQLIAKLREEEVRAEITNALQQNITTLRNRINELKVAEPNVVQQGPTRIVVQLPGVQDTAIARKVIGATATLEYRAVDTRNNVQEALAGRVPPESKLYRDRQGNPVLLSKKLIVSGDQLVHAASGIDQQSGTPMVSVRLNSVGAKRMQDFTNDNVGNGMAVVFIERKPEVRIVDGQEIRTSKVTEEVISIANIREPFGKNFQTTGLDSAQEASELALLLRAGSLAAPVDIVEERVVGPSLGADNIKAGWTAVIFSFVFVLVFFVVYYKMFGLIANIALLLNLLLLVAVMSVLGATLTLPGLAGIVLTVGMSVDANVLINERIREELRAGNTPLASIVAGYDKAAGTIADANLTALLAGLALFAFGSGPIQGFAVSLCAGIVTSMYTAVSVSRGITTLLYGRKRKLASLAI